MANLIIAEKPSVARDIAAAVKATSRQNGYLEGNGYIVTWAIGHLLEQTAPEEYDPKWKRWSLDTLPIVPEHHVLKPIENTKAQLATVTKLLKRKDLEKVVIATDAGREGELIAREILEYARCKTPQKLYRLWTSEALTPDVVQRALEDLKPAAQYDRLYHAAVARRNADWLVGMNLSRAVTCALGNSSTFSVGRVQTAVLALLVDRKRERENFTPTPYWNVVASFQGSRGQWSGLYLLDGKSDTKIMDRSVAEQIVRECTGQNATVVAVQHKEQKQAPPLVFSLTVLQQEASRLYSMTAQDTLAVAQKLYETYKVISYPRTDSQVLAESNVQLVKDVLAKLNQTYGSLTQHIVPSLISAKNTHVFNDKKLTDHHAIIPLAPLSTKEATETEQKIYFLILRRFIAAFCKDYQYVTTTAITQVGSTHRYQSQGKVDKDLGWRAVYDVGRKNPEALPPLQQGDTGTVTDITIQDKQTEPPPDYTDATLLKDMTNPARYLTDAALKDVFKGEVGLGTQATRAEIIETLVRRGYAKRDKKTLIATAKGCHLIDALRQLPTLAPLTQPDNTAKWERELENIALNGTPNDRFLQTITTFVTTAVQALKDHKLTTYLEPDIDKQHNSSTTRRTAAKSSGRKRSTRSRKKAA